MFEWTIIFTYDEKLLIAKTNVNNLLHALVVCETKISLLLANLKDKHLNVFKLWWTFIKKCLLNVNQDVKYQLVTVCRAKPIWIEILLMMKSKSGVMNITISQYLQTQLTKNISSKVLTKRVHTTHRVFIISQKTLLTDNGEHFVWLWFSRYFTLSHFFLTDFNLILSKWI